MDKIKKMNMNLQYFATPEFDPDNVTMMDAKTGAIPVNISEEINTEVKQGSALMQLAKAVPMTKPIEEYTYMTGVGAYWVNEAERIRTSKPRFVKAEMRAHKLAVIIPTTKENLRYSVTNFFELMRPEIAEAFYKKIDEAGFTGGDSPWAFSLLSAAESAGNVVTASGNAYDDINDAMGFLEDEDKDANGIATTRSRRRAYRGTKDDNGLPIFNAATSGDVDNILGLPVAYVPKNVFNGASVSEFVGEWDAAHYGVLQGIEYEILTESTLTTVQDQDGNPLNLAERDMAAIKATMMIGFMVANEESFAVVKPVEAPEED